MLSIMCLRKCLSVAESSRGIWCSRYLTNIDSRIGKTFIVARRISRVCIELVRIRIVWWIDGSSYAHLVLIPWSLYWRDHMRQILIMWTNEWSVSETSVEFNDFINFQSNISESFMFTVYTDRKFQCKLRIM